MFLYCATEFIIRLIFLGGLLRLLSWFQLAMLKAWSQKCLTPGRPPINGLLPRLLVRLLGALTRADGCKHE